MVGPQMVGSYRALLGPYGPYWVHMGQYGPVWARVRPAWAHAVRETISEMTAFKKGPRTNQPCVNLPAVSIRVDNNVFLSDSDV